MDASARSPLRRVTSVVLTCLLSAPALPAMAEEATAAAAPAITTHWTCWYNGRTRVLCRLARAEAVDASLAEPYPGRTLLPETVRVIRERPAELTGRTLVIPLHSPPENISNAEELAGAVMCGNRVTCRVDFFRDVAELALNNEEDPASE